MNVNELSVKISRCWVIRLLMSGNIGHGAHLRQTTLCLGVCPAVTFMMEENKKQSETEKSCNTWNLL